MLVVQHRLGKNDEMYHIKSKITLSFCTLKRHIAKFLLVLNDSHELVKVTILTKQVVLKYSKIKKKVLKCSVAFLFHSLRGEVII